MKQYTFSLVAAAALALMLVWGRTAGAVTLQANADISLRPGGEAETAIAIDPTNPMRVFAVSNIDGGTGLFSARSVDGGLTWTTQILADGSGDALITACCDPSVAFDTFGNLWMGYINAAINGVELGLSTDGGATWTNQGPVATGSNIDQPTVTTGPKDSGGGQTVWMTYVNNNGKPSARGAEITGLGTHNAFIAEEETVNTDPLCTATTNPDCGNFGDISVGPDGQLLVAYQVPSSGQGPATIYVNLDDDGLGPHTFGSAVQVTSTNVGGFDTIPAQSSRSIDAEAGLAWDRSGGTHNGRVYFVYTDETPDESNNTDIMLRSSDDNGAHWTGAVKLNDDATTNSQFLPKISLDETTGDIAVTWLDARNDDGSGPNANDVDGVPNDDAQLYGTLSTDGGATFATNFKISQGTSHAATASSSTDYGDYLGLNFFDGVFFPLWSDNSNSAGGNPNGTLHQFDIYTAKTGLTATDVSIAMMGSPGSVHGGDNVTYHMTVTNNGPNDSDHNVVSDNAPSGFSFVSVAPSQGGCSGTSKMICDLGAIANGASATIDLVLKAGVDGNIMNAATAGIRIADTDLSNNSATANTTVAALCGNGIKEPGEQCDDGNTSNADACLNTCIAAKCGDGFVHAGVEQCDDGNTVNGDGCDANCTLPGCGNGVVDAGEECDDGSKNSDTAADACRMDCVSPHCGDGVVDAGEQCDDGNTISGDGCSADCQTETPPAAPVCGNGVVETGEECDDGNTVSGDGCSSDCKTESGAPPKKSGGCALIPSPL